MTAPMELRQLILTRKARIGIIGLGYVGLPLAMEFAKKGFRTVGFEVDPAKVRDIARGSSYIADVSSADLAEQVRSGRLRAAVIHRTL